MPNLIIRKAEVFYKEMPLPELDIVLIGRSALSDVVLPDPSNKVSRYHAVLVHLSEHHGKYFIRDLGSFHSTIVSGETVYFKLLADGDVIKIGDYAIQFEMTTKPAQSTSHLTVVAKKHRTDAEDKPTIPLLRNTDNRDPELDGARLEIINQLHAMLRKVPNRQELAAWLMRPVSRVLGADRGFVRFFHDDSGDDFEDVGVIPSGHGCDIEISEEFFLDYLKHGECVFDGTTLLAPILSTEQTVGFFCLAKRPSSGVFLADDGNFLIRLGKEISSRQRRESDRRINPATSEFPMEWPVKIVGRSRVMQDLQTAIRQAAASDSNTIVIGETGSGKELVARAIHENSRFSKGPFVAKDCGQITPELAETALFGYTRNSGIHGANPAGAPGWFELANHGTLFLDEIQSLSVSLQEKFFRVLEDKKVCPFGATQSIPLDLKVVAATSATELGSSAEDGTFRVALYFRFRSRVRVPALRERREDIPILAYYFLDRLAHKLQAKTRAISHAAMTSLLNHDWPGNVRELEGVIEQAIGPEKGILFSWDFNLPAHGRTSESGSPAQTNIGSKHQAQEFKTMEQVEEEKIKEALEVTRGNITKSAEILGYKSRQTLLTKMDKFRIPRNYGDPCATQI
jgi:DNA-binding NtrC family response regulator/pSer/pThr/pTyr-binding forkhead associated (FHA) protein